MQILKIASVFVTEFNITMDNIHVAAWKYLSASEILNVQNCEGGILVDGHEQANNLISLCCIEQIVRFQILFNPLLSVLPCWIPLLCLSSTIFFRLKIKKNKILLSPLVTAINICNVLWESLSPLHFLFYNLNINTLQ